MDSTRRKERLHLISKGGTFIYGAGGHGRVVHDFFPSSELVVFVDDDAQGEAVYRPWEIPEDSRVVIAIGDNLSRQSVVEQLQKGDKNLIFPSVHHPSAELSSLAWVGEGSMLCARSVVITEAVVGDFCIINTAATVDHDCVLGDFVHIAPGAHLCGNVQVGNRTMVGTGACVCPGVSIGSDTVVGAGSVVVKDIPSGVMAYGNPCRVIREIK